MGGVFGACDGQVQPSSELCNALDDDCDGQTDEDFPELGSECAEGVGTCRTKDDFVCAEDGFGVSCPAIPSEPGQEVCNGRDDNCDGTVDDALHDILSDSEAISTSVTDIKQMSFDTEGEPQFC